MDDNVDLPSCMFCQVRNTKYKCITCNKPTCNICATPMEETTNGYSEEEKHVSKCPDCCTHSVNEAEECSMTTVNNEPPRKKIQRSIFSAFGKKSNPPKTNQQPTKTDRYR